MMGVLRFASCTFYAFAICVVQLDTNEQIWQINVDWLGSILRVYSGMFISKLKLINYYY